MTPPRIYCDPATELAPQVEVILAPEAARHVVAVLRMRAGDALTLFDGRGGEYAATLIGVDKRRVVVNVDQHRLVERETPHAATLVQSTIAADNMDLVVRRAVELGARAIVPVIAARSQRMAEDRALRRVAHWREIVIAACEQCGRNRVPHVAELLPLADWIEALRQNPSPTAVVVPDAASSLAQVAKASVLNALVVGPEGGLEAREVDALSAAGAKPAHLGARILRAETAAIAALATLNAVAGDAA